MSSKLGSKPGSSGKPNAAVHKIKNFKTIRKTEDLLKQTEEAKRNGKGNETIVSNGLGELVKAQQQLPGAVQVERFAEIRATEILALQRAVKSAAGLNNSRAFQTLPRHLRRRAASHNPRRVPKRMRNRAKAEIDAGDPTVRRHRKVAKLRARGNLRGQSRTEQLRRRQADKRWLGTHLYHARRFHMVNLWGYRLPLSPTLKSFRSSYRAARRNAIAHDASYYGTIELKGLRQDVVDVLSRVTAGGAFAGSKFESGTYAAQTHIYRPGTFPLGVIGPAEIVWMPSSESSTERRVWLRIHPAIYDDALATLNDASNIAGPSSKISSLQIRDMRTALEAFEIMGPRSGHVLKRVLKMCRTVDEGKQATVDSLLWKDPAEIPDGLVIGLKVYDPRLSFPPAKLPASPDDDGLSITLQPGADLAQSELWDEDARADLSRPRFKKFDLDQRRHKLDIAGARLRPYAQDDRVPVVIVKRTVASGNDEEAAAAFHGYTLLLPKGWSMAFLPSIVHCNVRLGGLAQRKAQYREAATPSFPEHYGAVTPASFEWETAQAAQAKERWVKKPPGKRPEFSTLGVRWPFQPDWESIISGPVNSEELATNGADGLHPWLFNTALAPFIKHLSLVDAPALSLMSAVNTFRRRRGLCELPVANARQVLNTALCHVEVNMIGRGSPSDMAMICSVSREDRDRWLGSGEQQPEQVEPTVIGFVSTGNVSLTRGEGHALGTVTLSGYLQLLDAARGSSQPDLAVVTVRNIDGSVHRLASLSLAQ